MSYFTLRETVLVIKSCRYCTLNFHFCNWSWCFLLRLDSPYLDSLYLLNDTFKRDKDCVVRLNLLSPFNILSPKIIIIKLNLQHISKIQIISTIYTIHWPCFGALQQDFFVLLSFMCLFLYHCQVLFNMIN